jgi:hypothetical protein
VQGYTPDRFVTTQMAEVPFLGNSSESVSVAVHRMYDKYPAIAAEHQGVKVLTVFTQGPGIGAAGAFFFALARGRLTPRVVFEVLVESARTTAMLFTILIAAMMFANFVNFTTMPGDLKDWILHLGLCRRWPSSAP